MTRIAIYARYSSDHQRDASIEDQVRVCREKADKEGWTVTQVYTDHAVSGASLIRPGVQMLLQDAQAGKFDLILSEALDRLSRDQADIASIRKRLQFVGIGMVTLAEGEINELHIGLKGTMNALFLKDLADKTRRGQRGRVEAGKSGGGLPYGYDVEELGQFKINACEAQIVVRIFEEYAAGLPPKKIAARLNAEHVPNRSGKGWSASTINGNRQRGTGILNNDLYVGRRIWNRTRKMKDPDTGVRLSRPNPPEMWVINEVPELRILPQELWDKAKARQKDLNERERPFWTKQRPVNLFSFLLKCGDCGGGYSKISLTNYGCSNARNKGEAVCGNRRTVNQTDLEYTILTTIRSRLMEPELVTAFCEEYTGHINKLRMTHNTSLHAYEAELEKIDRQEKRMVQAIMDGFANETLKVQMNALEDRKRELKSLLAGQAKAPTLLHPRMAQRYREEVTGLIDALNDEKHRPEAAHLIRSLIKEIVISPQNDSKRVIVDIHGDLAGILNMANGKPDGHVENELDLQHIQLMIGAGNGGILNQQDKMAPRAGFEPATDRLTADCSTTELPRNKQILLVRWI